MVTVFEKYRGDHGDVLTPIQTYVELEDGINGIEQYLMGIGYTEAEAIQMAAEGYYHVENRYFVLDITSTDDVGYVTTFRLIAEESNGLH